MLEKIGGVLGGGVAPPAPPPALTPLHLTLRETIYSVVKFWKPPSKSIIAVLLMNFALT